MIDIGFVSQSGTPFNLTIPSSELSVGPFASNTSLCQTLINAFDGLELVGGSLLKHYYSIWDLGGQWMGLAPAVMARRWPSRILLSRTKQTCVIHMPPGTVNETL